MHECSRWHKPSPDGLEILSALMYAEGIIWGNKDIETLGMESLCDRGSFEIWLSKLDGLLATPFFRDKLLCSTLLVDDL